VKTQEVSHKYQLVRSAFLVFFIMVRKTGVASFVFGAVPGLCATLYADIIAQSANLCQSMFTCRC
jgi:hypothetical protein